MWCMRSLFMRNRQLSQLLVPPLAIYAYLVNYHRQRKHMQEHKHEHEHKKRDRSDSRRRVCALTSGQASKKGAGI